MVEHLSCPQRRIGKTGKAQKGKVQEGGGFVGAHGSVKSRKGSD
jgi:hypothetical protein